MSAAIPGRLRLARVLTVGVSVLLALALAEGVLRVIDRGRSVGGYGDVQRTLRWEEHPFLPYIGRAGFAYTATFGSPPQRERVALNSYGFRAHEFPAAPRPDDFVVLAFGGSTTMGYHVGSNDRTWPERLEAMLGQRYPTQRIRVYNLGLDGATTAVSVVNMALVGVRLQPDAVIVYQGFNDLAALGFADQKWDQRHFYRDLDVDDVLRRRSRSHLLGAIFGAIGAPAINDLEPWTRKRRTPAPDRLAGIEDTLGNLRSIRALAESRGARTLFATFQFRDGVGNAAAFNDRLRALYRGEGFAWVDQDELIPDGDETLQVDACHFTDEGNDLLTRNFLDAIVELGWLP